MAELRHHLTKQWVKVRGVVNKVLYTPANETVMELWQGDTKLAHLWVEGSYGFISYGDIRVRVTKRYYAGEISSD